MPDALYRDILVTFLAFAIALSWLRLMDTFAHRGVIEPTLSRKLIHIGTGPLFISCWPLFSSQPWARWFAALVPLAITLKFIAIGCGLIQDPAAVQAMTRHNNPREILRGPLLYGAVFVGCTLIFWRHSPVGMLALMILCGGDGLADIVGRRWGKHKLPLSSDKSWVGSLAMFVGSSVFGYCALILFSRTGYFYLPTNGLLPLVVGFIALVATLIEALPIKDLDNLTLTLAAVALGHFLLSV